MPAPWRSAALLLCCACWCAGLEEGCVLGVVGRPVSLPCSCPNLSASLNVSIEWRTKDRAVFRSLWDEDGNVETWSVNHARVPTDALPTGNFSLELPSAHPKHDGSEYSLFLLSGENQSSPLCSRCLRVAASFGIPEVKKDPTDSSTYLCQSSGGFPQPAVRWLINNTQEAPDGSVSTQAEALPGSRLYNITTRLTIHADATVTCLIENPSMNETLSIQYGASAKTAGSRASEGMWIFSTVLCMVVAVMVIAGVYYQIHLDKISKRRRKENEEQRRGRRYQYKQAAEAMMPEPKETDV